MDPASSSPAPSGPSDPASSLPVPSKPLGPSLDPPPPSPMRHPTAPTTLGPLSPLPWLAIAAMSPRTPLGPLPLLHPGCLALATAAVPPQTPSDPLSPSPSPSPSLSRPLGRLPDASLSLAQAVWPSPLPQRPLGPPQDPLGPLPLLRPGCLALAAATAPPRITQDPLRPPISLSLSLSLSLIVAPSWRPLGGLSPPRLGCLALATAAAPPWTPQTPHHPHPHPHPHPHHRALSDTSQTPLSPLPGLSGPRHCHSAPSDHPKTPLDPSPSFPQAVWPSPLPPCLLRPPQDPLGPLPLPLSPPPPSPSPSRPLGHPLSFAWAVIWPCHCHGATSEHPRTPSDPSSLSLSLTVMPPRTPPFLRPGCRLALLLPWHHLGMPQDPLRPLLPLPLLHRCTASDPPILSPGVSSGLATATVPPRTTSGPPWTTLEPPRDPPGTLPPPHAGRLALPLPHLLNPPWGPPAPSPSPLLASWPRRRCTFSDHPGTLLGPSLPLTQAVWPCHHCCVFSTPPGALLPPPLPLSWPAGLAAATAPSRTTPGPSWDPLLASPNQLASPLPLCLLRPPLGALLPPLSPSPRPSGLTTAAAPPQMPLPPLPLPLLASWPHCCASLDTPPPFPLWPFQSSTAAQQTYADNGLL
ncbi:hypothetical protein BJY52DRAFT_1192473 [Lactarius psammicola]|nr:hypothetical protein BJY52DRAFT_1192473 [Lactarius psammicola]